MKILNFGSLNIDYVYAVDHFVRPGETLASSSMERHSGGKGLNQSIALANAGLQVFHGGKIGPEGEFLRDGLTKAGVNTDLIIKSDQPTGHAIIQVAPSGENSILLYGGANRSISKHDVDHALSRCTAGDWLLTQNETNNVPYLLERAAARGLKNFINPAPMTLEVSKYPLHLVSMLIVNEIEGAGLSGKTEYPEILKALRQQYPHAAVLLTLGAQGILYADQKESFSRAAEKAKVVDTTGAGDTFTGYFLASLAEEWNPRIAADRASRAAAICVSRRGAADSIPKRGEVLW